MQDLGDLRQLSTAYSGTLLDKNNDDFDDCSIQYLLNEALVHVVQEIRVWAQQHKADGRYRDAEFLYRRVSFNGIISLESTNQDDDKDVLSTFVSIYETMGDYPAAEMVEETLLKQLFPKISNYTTGEQNRAVHAYIGKLSDFRKRSIDITSRLQIPVEKYIDLFIVYRIAVLDIPLLNDVSLEQGLINFEPNKDHYCILLHIAAKQNAFNLAPLLIQKCARIDNRDWRPCMLLHIAASLAVLAMTELLLANGADIKAVDECGRTPLHAALEGEASLEIVAMLINAKVDLDAKDALGETALTIAIRRDQSVAALFLLEQGAEIDGSNAPEETPLLTAVRNRREWAIEPLLEKGANLKARNVKGETALYAAVEQGQESVIHILLDHSAITKTTVDQQNSKHYTCLGRAVKDANLSIVEILLHAGADICAKDFYGGTALHQAVMGGEDSHDDIVHLLLSHSAPLDTANKFGETVFHLAARYGRPNLISILIQNVKPNRLPIVCGMRDDRGRTALDNAVFRAENTTMSSDENWILLTLESALGLPHSFIRVL